MTVDPLLSAIVRANGSALILHVGERPYVVAGRDQVEISTRALTPEAVAELLGELLSPEAATTLDELGAVEHQLPPSSSAAGERFDVVAARGGNDVWIEIRRKGGASEQEVAEPPAAHEIPPVTMVPVPPSRMQPHPPVELPSAVVLPLARSSPRAVPSVGAPAPSTAGDGQPSVDALLVAASRRGASSLHVQSGARASIRVDGQLTRLEGQDALAPSDVQGLLDQSMPAAAAEVFQASGRATWTRDVDDVGSVQAVAFLDIHGPGAVFSIRVPRRLRSADQLGLSREILGLVGRSDGLVLVTGPRGHGKRTLVAALVDWINRTRADSIITLEREVVLRHTNRTAVVSQRTLRGDAAAMASMARASLLEDPDVLVVEGLQHTGLAEVALEAAASGRLVIGVLPAASTTEAIRRLVALAPADRRPATRLLLADGLRGAVAQVLLRRTGPGGRLAAREVLLGVPELLTLIADDRVDQLPAAVSRGRSEGMVPLNDVLTTVVENGTVDAREAYRVCPDRQDFLERLRRDGVDTSFAERLA